MSLYPQRRPATLMLLLATIFWGVSFPTMRAISLAQERLLPEAGSWFITSITVLARFGVAALLMAIWSWKTLRQLTRLELAQGAGLALFGGAGILLQMDGLAYTSASTSAFLTQCYCVIIPLIVAWRERRRPSWVIAAGTLMVLTGVAVLAKIDLRTVKLGRGEWETILASIVFTGQILWLERPQYSRNRVDHFSLVMFAGIALMALPVCLLTMHQPGDLLRAYRAPLVIGLTAILVLACTMVAYLMMNYWQPRVPATEAGLIYTVEPLFASLFALFLPEWFASFGGFTYANEKTTLNLLIGGGLITAANVLVQLRPAHRPPVSAGPALQATPS